jgi:uncharacterized protein YkwD
MKAFSAICIAVALGTWPSVMVPAPAQALDSSQVADYVMSDTNAYRQAHGQKALDTNSQLRQAAQSYAEFLAQKNASGHTADGRNWESRAEAAGYKPCFVTENLYDYSSEPNLTSDLTLAREAMTWWKGSREQDANLKEGQVRDIGVGVAAWPSGGKTIYRVVQLMGDDCLPRKYSP